MKYLLVLLLFLFPGTSLAHDVVTRAGTDDYLRDEMGWTEEQLQTQIATEGREAFDTFTGTGTAFDPLGDVLTRYGTTSDIAAPWGDIESATLSRNDETHAWDLVVMLGGTVPQNPSIGTQLFFLVDSDDFSANNEPEGIRIHTDAEFAIQYNAQGGWYTDFRWYNSEADFWAMNKETTSTFDITDKTFTLHIPYTDLSSDPIPRWRVVMALADGDASQIDAAPTIGFPSESDTTSVEPSAEEANKFWTQSTTWVVAGVLAILIGLGIYGIRFARRRKTGSRD